MAAAVNCQAGEPKSWKEAIQEEGWLESMKRERDALKSVDAYTLVAQDADTRVERGIWRFRTKLDQSGNVVKLKSRYVLDPCSLPFRPYGEYTETIHPPR